MEKLNIVESKNIENFTTMRLAVLARYYSEVQTEDEFVKAMKFAMDNKLPYVVIGGGSNIVFKKNVYDGLVIKKRLNGINLVEESEESVLIRVGSGVIVSVLIDYCQGHGFSGFEYHLGLPGTVGGAIYMNSKWTRPLSYFGDNLVSAEILDKNVNRRREEKEYFEFAYDYSILQKSKEIVLTADFRLNKDNPEILKSRAKASLEYRKKTQPFAVATSGCYFRNISKSDAAMHNLPTTSAGYLIDNAGLKGKCVGKFRVSDKHANFIINEGKGKPEDLSGLASIIKKQVFDKYGVELVEEVIAI